MKSKAFQIRRAVIPNDKPCKKSPSLILPQNGGEDPNAKGPISFPRLGGRSGWGLLTILLLIIPRLAQPAETLQKIRIGFPSLAFSYMPFYVAKEKGFLKKHNL